MQTPAERRLSERQKERSRRRTEVRRRQQKVQAPAAKEREQTSIRRAESLGVPPVVRQRPIWSRRIERGVLAAVVITLVIEHAVRLIF